MDVPRQRVAVPTQLVAVPVQLVTEPSQQLDVPCKLVAIPSRLLPIPQNSWCQVVCGQHKQVSFSGGLAGICSTKTSGTY